MLCPTYKKSEMEEKSIPNIETRSILSMSQKSADQIRCGNINNNRDNELKQLKQEIADLLAEDDNMAARFCVY